MYTSVALAGYRTTDHLNDKFEHHIKYNNNVQIGLFTLIQISSLLTCGEVLFPSLSLNFFMLLKQSDDGLSLQWTEF